MDVSGVRLSPWEIETILDMSVALREAVKIESERKPELSMESLDSVLSGVAKK